MFSVLDISLQAPRSVGMPLDQLQVQKREVKDDSII